MQSAIGERMTGLSSTIVMVHGMWSTPGVWANFASYFRSHGFSVRTPALRHHDGGPRDSAAIGRISLADHVGDLAKFIGDLGGRPILIGHSMGGLIVQQLAARGMACATVLLAPATPPGIASLNPSTARLFYPALLRRKSWERAHLPRRAVAAHALFQLLTPAEREQQIAALVPESGRALFEIALPWLDKRQAARIDLERIRCPVLIIAGSQDRTTPAAGARHLKRRYGAGATYVELPDHAHWLIGEPGWENVAKIAEDWIRDVRPQD